MIRFRVLLGLSLIGLVLAACTGTAVKMITVGELNIRAGIEELVRVTPNYFETPYTLIVMLDRQACGGNLVETNYWPAWQSYMRENGFGFVFVTSRLDSIEMVTALEFENMTAPILVLPGHEETISSLWSPSGLSKSRTIKVLIDSTAKVRFATASTTDLTSNREMLDEISLITGTDNPTDSLARN